jgi:hypothetical protein
MGYGLNDVSPAIKIVEQIREIDEVGICDNTSHSNLFSL